MIYIHIYGFCYGAAVWVFSKFNIRMQRVLPEPSFSVYLSLPDLCSGFGFGSLPLLSIARYSKSCQTEEPFYLLKQKGKMAEVYLPAGVDKKVLYPGKGEIPLFVDGTRVRIY